MNGPCNCDCHGRQIECEPCYRFHSMVEWLRADLEGSLRQIEGHIERFPIIRDHLIGQREAKADTLRWLNVWAGNGGDRPPQAVVEDRIPTLGDQDGGPDFETGQAAREARDWEGEFQATTEVALAVVDADGMGF